MKLGSEEKEMNWRFTSKFMCKACFKYEQHNNFTQTTNKLCHKCTSRPLSLSLSLALFLNTILKIIKTMKLIEITILIYLFCLFFFPPSQGETFVKHRRRQRSPAAGASPKSHRPPLWHRPWSIHGEKFQPVLSLICLRHHGLVDLFNCL